MRPALIALFACAALASACASRPKPSQLAGQVPGGGAQTDGASGAPRAGAPEAGSRPGSQADFAANAGDRVYFAYDSHEISPEAADVLRRQAAWLQRYPAARVMVAGNADERGTREYNLALGARRAAAVRQFLIAQGVTAQRLTTVSYGKERPIDTRDTEEAWSVNRNAHTALMSELAAAW